MIEFTDSADPKNFGSVNFTAEAETQITMGLRSSHPNGETHFVAGFPVWVQAEVNFNPSISGKLPAGTITIRAGSGEPTCSVVLDDTGVGECALIFASAGPKTVVVDFLGETDIRASTTQIDITVVALNVPQAVSAGRNHTCFLAANGWMTCWGLPDATPVDKFNNPLPQGYFSQISAGGYQTCGLKVDGTIACWGDNIDVTRNIPTGQFINISSGDEHVCAIDTVNRLHCWGHFRLGWAAEPAVKVTAVSAGEEFDCAIRKNNNQPVCWGTTNSAPAITITALAVGNTHSCALKTDGALACWGTPAMAVPAGNTYTEIASGSAYSCALNSANTITCWGSNAPTVDNSTPFHQLASGFLHTCALQPVGPGPYSLSCWGDNSYGKAPRISLSPDSISQYLVKNKPFIQTLSSQGGTAPYTLSLESGSLPAGLSLSDDAIFGIPTTPNTYSVTLSAAETFPNTSLPLALTPALRTYTTTVMDGTTTSTLTLPTQVNAGSPAAARVTVTKIATQPDLTGSVLVTSADGNSYCRAEVNGSGVAQCTLYFSRSGLQTVNVTYEGDSYFEKSTTTEQITINPVVIAPAVGAGDQFTCSLDADGHLACWGKVSAFQIPIPSTGIFDQLDLGKAHACGLGMNRRATCWGWNGYGIATPPAAFGVTRVTTGSEHSCLLTDLGVVSCWGKNEANRLTVPGLGGGRKYTDIDAGADHTCAIDDAGAVKCWGLNGTEGRIDVPSDLLTRGKVTKISAGGSFTCAVHENGALDCWGGLGVIDSIRTEPAGEFTDVSAGKDFACGLKADGSPVCWGNLTNQPAGAFTRIAAGYDHVCGIMATGRMQCWGRNDVGQAPVIALSPTSLPTIDVGAPWTAAISATGGRVANYSYSAINGALPSGLNLDSNTGIISGTPAQAGIYSFAVQAQENNLSPAVAAARAYSLTVRGLVNAAINSALPAGAMVGRPIQVAFSVHARPGNEMSAEPTGTVTVSAEENRCVVELVNGTGTCPMLFGSAGTKTITIAYPGDGLYQAGDPLAAGFDYLVIPFSQGAQLRTGLNQTYVYKADGTVGCIGENCELDGQFTRFGVGDAYACGLHTNGGLLCEVIDAAAPPLVFNNGPYIDLSVGKAHVCALKIDGQAACLGDQTHGQAAPPAGSFTSLSAGGGHTCALKENGEAVCWGEISGPPPGVFTRLISGEAHTCGLRPGGGMACWGDASNANMGQLNLPESAGVFTQIAAGGEQTCGLNPNGEVTCWQVDAPDSTYSVVGRFVALAAYDDHVCGLRAGLKLTCWGEDDAGEAPQFAFDRLNETHIPALSYYEHAFNVSGGTKPFTAEVVEGTLPPGLDVVFATQNGAGPAPLSGVVLQDLSPAGMILYGTPHIPGVYPFVVRWTDVSPYPLVMEQAYALTITGADLAVDLSPFSPAEALVNTEYKFKAVVSNQTALTVPGGVVLTINVPDGLTSLESDQPACVLSGSKLVCPLGAIDPSLPKTVWVKAQVAVQAGQTLKFSASVNSTLPDWPEIASPDNSDSFTVGVAYKSTVFSDNFEQAPSAAWTAGTQESAPNGITHYFSMHDDQKLSLDLSGLPPHKSLLISFDLYIIGSWLGNNPNGVPSEWMFGELGMLPLLHTSFSNDPGIWQGYPTGLPGGENPARQGSAGSDELTYTRDGKPVPDTRYQLAYRLPHSAEELHLVFSSLNLAGGAWWGLDRVSVMIDSGHSQIFLPVIKSWK